MALAPITLWVLDPVAGSSPTLARSISGPQRNYAIAAIILALLGSVTALAAQAVTVAPDRSLPDAISQTLAETRYGQIWLWRIGLLVAGGALIVGALWGRAHWRRPLLIAATSVSLAMPIPFSLLSHAAAQTEGRAAAISADVLHLLLASFWTGGLFMLALVFVPALRPLPPEARRDALRIALPRFSVVGIAAWGVLVLSGLYSSWLQVGSLEALRGTDYGQSLLLKGALLCRSWRSPPSISLSDSVACLAAARAASRARSRSKQSWSSWCCSLSDA